MCIRDRGSTYCCQKKKRTVVRYERRVQRPNTTLEHTLQLVSSPHGPSKGQKNEELYNWRHLSYDRVYGYDPKTKVQSSQWKHSSSLWPKKPRQVHSKIKVMLIVFFDSCGIVHHEYAPQGQTVTKEYYLEVMHHFRDAVRCKRLDLWMALTWQLHHDNVPAHSSHLIQTFLAKNNTPQLRLSPYSSDMPPCDFWLFTKLKMLVKGT